MNSFTNTILTLLLGWLRALLNAARDFVSSDSSTAFFNFFQNNWRVLFIILCIIGISLDIIVYIVRWRPQPLWRKRKAKPVRELSPAQDSNDYTDYYDTDSPAIPTGEYAPVPDTVNEDFAALPTTQYQIQSKESALAQSTQSVTLPYTTPYFAPESSAYQEEIPQLYTDEAAQEPPFGARQQRYAFGMAPSFGSAQSEPAYNFQQDSSPPFAPPQYTQEIPPAVNFAPAQSVAEVFDEPIAQQPQEYQQSSPYFRPFSDRSDDTSFSTPTRSRGFGAVARRAKTLLNADEVRESLSYRDLHPTVDVSKAFHSPVYPEKKSDEDA